MKPNKLRHNNENQLSKPCNKMRNWTDKNGRIYCSCYDGTYTNDDGTVHTILEFADPWCDPDSKDGCKCNPYNCLKTKNKWYASLSKEKQDRIESGKAKYYSNEITIHMSTKDRKQLKNIGVI